MADNPAVAYGQSTLASGIRSRFIDHINGLRVHFLEAGFETPGRPCVLLLHGFPELAYSWRRVMLPLAAAGYHVVAPDQRGYGRTTGWSGDYDGDIGPFRFLNLVTDVLALVKALGHDSIHGLAGHDFGSPVAAWCALIRPDVFRCLALMSAPFGGPPALHTVSTRGPTSDIHADLAALDPPRKHYQWYYSTRAANVDMLHCPQGVHAFLRAYFHVKSADWEPNRPYRLGGWRAGELARLPTYYIMELNQDMAATVARQMPSPAQIAACAWLPETELAVYSGEFSRTGFQGGLNWYRCATDPVRTAELRVFSGRTVDVPACFIAGGADWGVFQKPGDFETMQESVCTRMQGVHLLDGAGHWVQQEQPDRVAELLIEFLRQPHSG